MADRSGHFAMGEISQRCYDGLRVAGEHGVSPDDLALKAMADKGVDPADEAMRKDFMRRFHWALARIQGQERNRHRTPLPCPILSALSGSGHLAQFEI